jgi:eukaryotic-like serine/threonine-protein kinase
MPNTPKNLREWFERAMEISPIDREQWLQQQDIDATYLAELQKLLQAEAQPIVDWVDRSRLQMQHWLMDRDTQRHLDLPEIGGTIGVFRLKGLIGQGGMASVYVAERTDGNFPKNVAVKLLRHTLRTDLDRRLFAREQRALSILDHPNVARLIEGGVTPSHQPFLVMDFIQGLSLDRYCEQAPLNLTQRVELFLQVCDGVQACHRALIVHRDIKPNNVLVTPDGVVKLLDFGVAKMLELEHESRTTQTVAPLTPAYAAPEQFGGLAITTATDVYQLGMVLHQLLTGHLRRVGDTTRASTLTQQHWEVSLDTLKFLRGDVDNILRKAMSQEPQDRYATAGDLADDLRRFLSGQAVQAHPPSNWYRLKKFIRRNQAASVTTAISMLGLLLALGVALHQSERARAQYRRAIQAQSAAELEAKNAASVRDFLVKAFRSTEPGPDGRSQQTMLEFTEQAVLQLNQNQQLHPDVRANLQATLGTVLANQGKVKDSVMMLQTAIDASSLQPVSAASEVNLKSSLASVLYQINGYERALTVLQPFEARRADLLPDAQAHAWIQLAQAYSQTENNAKATQFANDALSLCETTCRDETLHAALEALANVHASFSRNIDSEKVYRRQIPLTQKLYGEQGVEMASLLAGLSRALRRQGRLDEALVELNKALVIDHAILPALHMRRATHLSFLGALHHERNDLLASEQAFAQSLSIAEALSPPGFPQLALDVQNLAVLQTRQGKFTLAAKNLTRALAMSIQAEGPHSQQSAMIRGNWAHVMMLQGQSQSAERELAIALDDLRRAGASQVHILLPNLIRESQLRQWTQSGKNPLQSLDEADQVLRRFGANLSLKEQEKVDLQRAVVLFDTGQREQAKRLIDQLSHGQLASAKPSVQSVELLLLDGLLKRQAGEWATAKLSLERAKCDIGFQVMVFPYIQRRINALTREIERDAPR